MSESSASSNGSEAAVNKTATSSRASARERARRKAKAIYLETGNLGARRSRLARSRSPNSIRSSAANVRLHRTGSIELNTDGRLSISPRARASRRIAPLKGRRTRQRRSPGALRQRLGALNRVHKRVSGRKIGSSSVSLRGGGTKALRVSLTLEQETAMSY